HSSSFPPRVVAPGFSLLPTPLGEPRGGWSAARRKPNSARARRGRVLPDALTSRRSTVALLRSGAALLATGIASGAVERAPRSRVVVPGGRGPQRVQDARERAFRPSEPAVTSRRRGTPHLAPPW